MGDKHNVCVFMRRSLRHHVAAVHEGAGHVLAVLRVALHEHRGRVEGARRDLRLGGARTHRTPVCETDTRLGRARRFSVSSLDVTPVIKVGAVRQGSHVGRVLISQTLVSFLFAADTRLFPFCRMPGSQHSGDAAGRRTENASIESTMKTTTAVDAKAAHHGYLRRFSASEGRESVQDLEQPKQQR